MGSEGEERGTVVESAGLDEVRVRDISRDMERVWGPWGPLKEVRCGDRNSLSREDRGDEVLQEIFIIRPRMEMVLLKEVCSRRASGEIGNEVGQAWRGTEQ